MLEIVSSCINCVNYFPSLIKFVCLRTLQTLDKGRSFFLKDMFLSIIMDESASLQENLIKIKHIKEQ
jgi:hypothetical protein